MIKKKMSIDVSGLNDNEVGFICKFFDIHNYVYVASVDEYDDIPEEWRHMTMLDYIKGLDKKEMMRFIYWVYS